jgi:hypothetical protein
MERRFTLADGLSLATTEPQPPRAIGAYPTDGLQKGLLLLDGEQELSGEGVGFGVPVLKRGPRAVFAGSCRVVPGDAGPRELTLVYRMDRVERLGGRRRPRRALAPLELVRETLSLAYRRVPPLRRPLTSLSNAGRRLLRVRTWFDQTTVLAELPVTYEVGGGQSADAGCLLVTAHLGSLPATVTEVVLMNELGASFDLYEEGGRALHAGEIGAWDAVRAPSARFRNGAAGVWFELMSRPDPAAPQVRLLRGRESAAGRLAWAGFGYSLRPGPSAFTYPVHFGREAGAMRAAAAGEPS